MTNLKKFLVLTAALVLALSVGADSALAQTLCIANEAETLKKVRSEGITELVSDIYIFCGEDAGTLDNTEQTGIRASVTFDEGVTITNARNDDDIAEDIILVLHTSNDYSDGERWVVADEWDASDTDGVDGVNNTANGRIDGNTVEFRFGHSAIAGAGATRRRRFAISGIRVDATGGSNVRATVNISRTNTYDLPQRNTRVTVADPTTGLETSRQGDAIEGVTCVASAAIGASGLNNNSHGDITTLRLKEGYPKAFQEGDQFMLTFSGVPEGVTPYLRPGDENGDGDDTNDDADNATTSNDICGGAITVQLQTGLDSDRAARSPSNAYEFVEVGLNNGSGTEYYKVTGIGSDAGKVECDIPIYWHRATGAGLGEAIVSASFAPVSTVKGYASSAPIPRFVETTKTLPPMIGLRDCSTTLLFPFVTNQLNFDTGIVISNTSDDPLSTSPHEGTCEIHYYGSMTGGEPTTSQTSDMIEAGGQLIFSLSGGSEAMNIEGRAGFQGYLMAQCTFQFAHGLAFITNNFGVGAPSLAHGYLALVVPLSDDGDRMTGAGGTEMLDN